MSVKDTTILKMLSNGNKYQIEKIKYENLEGLLQYAKDKMISPNMIHFISHIVDPEEFKTTKKDLIKLYQRALKRQFTGLDQKCPDTLVAYSIEFKYTTQKEIDGKKDAYQVGNSVWKKTDQKLSFLHLHFYVIADCNRTHPGVFSKLSMQALNELKGLRASRYMPRKQTKEQIQQKAKKLYYHALKNEFDDAFDRILYIGKIEQKDPNIPYRNKFGMSKIS